MYLGRKVAYVSSHMLYSKASPTKDFITYNTSKATELSVQESFMEASWTIVDALRNLSKYLPVMS